MPVSLARQIGQLLIGSLPGTSVTPEFRGLVRDHAVGGVTLFARNLESAEHVREFSDELRGLSRDWPLWVAIDQEGGRVARLRSPFTEWPPMAALGRSGDLSLARQFASALAAELTAVGVTLDFAPVLDVMTNEANPVIGDRAFSADAERVADFGAAIIQGLQDNGVAACGKHFPGHGDTSVDSHLALPLVEHPPDRIRRVECIPFQAAIRQDVAFMMTAHILVPSMDEARPATLAPSIVTGLLREELGFRGVILSDDLEMKAIADHYTVPDAAVQAIAAGCDGVLICHGSVELQALTLDALIHAVEDGRIPRRRAEDALARNRVAKERFLAARRVPSVPLRQVLGCEAHRRVAEAMHQYA